MGTFSATFPPEFLHQFVEAVARGLACSSTITPTWSEGGRGGLLKAFKLSSRFSVLSSSPCRQNHRRRESRYTVTWWLAGPQALQKPYFAIHWTPSSMTPPPSPSCIRGPACRQSMGGEGSMLLPDIHIICVHGGMILVCWCPHPPRARVSRSVSRGSPTDASYSCDRSRHPTTAIDHGH